MVMALEINSIFLKKNWIFDWTRISNFLSFSELNFFSIITPLNFFIISKESFFKKKIEKQTTFNFLNELILNSIYNIFSKNILKTGWSNITEKNYNFNNFTLKNFIYQTYSDVFNSKITNFRFFDYNFFYNIYYYNLIIFLLQKKLNSFYSNIFNKIYYYGSLITTLYIQNYFEYKISIYNKYLSMQKGFSKKTSVFINWHYLFSTSTQILKFSINNFYKFFFKNYIKIINWKNFQFFFKKKDSWKFEKLNSKSGIFIWDRKLPILPQYVSKIFYIYNGTRFFKLWVVPAMVGYKFGSFSFTRRILAKDYKSISSFKNIV